MGTYLHISYGSVRYTSRAECHIRDHVTWKILNICCVAFYIKTDDTYNISYWRKTTSPDKLTPQGQAICILSVHSHILNINTT